MKTICVALTSGNRSIPAWGLTPAGCWAYGFMVISASIADSKINVRRDNPLMTWFSFDLYNLTYGEASGRAGSLLVGEMLDWTWNTLRRNERRSVPMHRLSKRYPVSLHSTNPAHHH